MFLSQLRIYFFWIGMEVIRVSVNRDSDDDDVELRRRREDDDDRRNDQSALIVLIATGLLNSV